jgi:hypothetical protein
VDAKKLPTASLECVSNCLVYCIQSQGTPQNDEASEYWTNFGHHLKITDTLLVLFTFAPWWATQGLWDGKWPGEADCERLGFFVNGDRARPDINRLLAECHWDPERQWWEHNPSAEKGRRTMS